MGKKKTVLDTESSPEPAECMEGRSRMITRQTSRELGISDNLFVSIPLYKRKRESDDTITKGPKKLDTNMFHSYLEDLWSKISDDKKSSCTYLDCLWFYLYKKGPEKSKVLMWIRRKNIISKRYVFVPILCWRHWSLLILCHFGESNQSETQRPCMLLLDSLQNANPLRLESYIRRFVLDVYMLEGRGEMKECILDIPLLVPKVPQQRNGEECGVFVLYFINLFLINAPEVFTLEDYPYFLTENWFELKDLERFRNEMESRAKMLMNSKESEYCTGSNDWSFLSSNVLLLD